MADEGPYDVIVVGAGSAGAVLAGRLSEDPARSVLLLEAGPDHTSAETPAPQAGLNFFAALSDPTWFWPDLMAERKAGIAASVYLRGRGVGGSSAINGMIAIRGTPDDYDHWARDLGCPGWGWADMASLFRAVEDDVDFGGDGLHGQGGPIPLARTPFGDLPPLDLAMRTAATALGYPVVDDYHAPDATGLSRVAHTVRAGRRVSTNDAYLEPARTRPNLTIRGGVLVDRVLLRGTTTTGVVTAAGERIGGREVLLSAGAIHSPAVLLRSGIGPATGLAVGSNLLEHPATPGFELHLVEAGRMASPDALLVGSLLRYSSGLAGAGGNDMQILWFAATGGTRADLAGGRVLAAVMAPYSSGRVRLRSDDPADQPEVSFDLLSDERDRHRLRDATRRVLELLEQPALGTIVDGATAGSEPLGSLSSGAAIDAWLASGVSDYVHAAGTCRMGSAGDPAAVVDPACRVIGFSGLRVCDASVMPTIPRANTHLPTVALAEGIAQLMVR